MRWCIPIVSALAIGAGCKGGDGTTSDNPDDTGGDTGPYVEPEVHEPFRSSFREGRFAVSALELLVPSEGFDLTGDGLPDNNLPNALKPIDLLLSDMDLSLTGFNDTIAAAIDVGQLVILFDAHHQFPTLEVDVLSGVLDYYGTITVDPGSFVSGAPRSHLSGRFVTERAFELDRTEAAVPIILIPNTDPVWVPLVEMRMVGELDEDGMQAKVGGIIPADRLVDEVIDPAIDPDGYDANGDGTIDYTKAQLLSTFRGFAALESIADVDLGDGQRGISVAFDLVAEPASFAVP